MTIYVSVGLDEDLKDRLDSIAAHREMALADLLAEAATALVEDDAAFRKAVEAGLASMRAGRTTPHEEVVERLRRRHETRAAE